MVFSAHIFNQLFIKLKNSNNLLSGILFIILINGLYVSEAFSHHEDVSKSIIESPNLFKYELLPPKYKVALSQIDSDNFQAILTLPFYYYGSESFARPRDDASVRSSIVLSYHTGLPNFCTSLTRTSISESKKIVQLLSPNFYEKKIKGDLKSNKPILIIQECAKLTFHEKNILRNAKLIHSGDGIKAL